MLPTAPYTYFQQPGLKMLIKNIFSIFLMQEKEDKAILSLISFLTVLFENKSLI